jgi:hypothetical protein
MQGTNSITKPRQKSKRYRGLVIVTTIIAGLVGFGWMWWSRMTAMPVVTIPTPILPSPNAFDIFVQIGNGLQNERLIRQAVAPTTGQRLLNQAEKAQLVADNNRALKELRAGLQCEYLHPFIPSYMAPVPHAPKFRSMAHLLALEGQVYAGRGEWNKALHSDLDAIQFGLTIPRGMIVFGHILSIACEALGRKGAWEAVERQSASEAKSAALRLEKMLVKRHAYGNALEVEKRCLQATLLEMFRDPHWRTNPRWLMDNGHGVSDDWQSRLSRLPFQSKLHLYSNDTILNNATRYLDIQIARMHQPYSRRSAPPPEPSDPVNQILAWDCDQAALKDLTAQSQDALLLLALALHAYRLEQGSYPPKLDTLVPRYLTQLPEDPFGQGTFLYKRTNSKYLLYSVGPDKTDDGGRPIDDPSKVSGSNARYFVQPDSQGDIVVGVNKY